MRNLRCNLAAIYICCSWNLLILFVLTVMRHLLHWFLKMIAISMLDLKCLTDWVTE
jgi:hypothetical protein